MGFGRAEKSRRFWCERTLSAQQSFRPVVESFELVTNPVIQTTVRVLYGNLKPVVLVTHEQLPLRPEQCKTSESENLFMAMYIYTYKECHGGWCKNRQ